MADDFDDLRPTNLRPLPLRVRPKREGRQGRNQGGPTSDGGRDPAFANDAIRSRLLTFIRAGAQDNVAARACGIHRATFSRWKQRGREGEEPYATFFEEVEEAEAFAETRLVGLWSAAAQTDYRAARDLLRVRFRERWNADLPAAGLSVEDEELIEPRDDVDQLSEVMAAYEEAGIVPAKNA